MTRAYGRRVHITGIGLVSAAGRDLSDVWNSVNQGPAALTAIDAYDTLNCSMKSAFICSEEEKWQLPQRKLRKFAGKKDLLAIAAAQLAAKDCGEHINEIPEEKRGCFVGASSNQVGDFIPYFSSVLRCVSADNQTFDSNMFGRDCLADINPLAPTKVLLNGALSHICQAFGLRGENANLMDFEVSGLRALEQACDAIANQRIDLALVVSMNDPIDPFIQAAALKANKLANDAQAYPYDKRMHGYMPGQMGVALVLTAGDYINSQSGRPPYAEIIAARSTTAFPSESESTQRQALADSLKQAAQANNCQAILGQGLGLACHDRLEILAAEQFASEQKQSVRFGSFSSLVGMSEEAGALFDIAMATQMLSHQIWPEPLRVSEPLLPSTWLNMKAEANQNELSNIAIMRRSRVGLNSSIMVSKSS